MALSPQAQAILDKYKQGDSAQNTTVESEATPSSSDVDALKADYQVSDTPKGGNAPIAVSDAAHAILAKYKPGYTAPSTTSPQSSPTASQGQSSTLQSIGKGAVENFGGGPVINGIHYLESKFPELMGILNEGGLDSVYGPGFSSPNTTDQQRRDMIEAHTVDWKKDFISKYYNDVDTSNHPYLSKFGQFLGGMADPSSLINPELQGLTWVERMSEMAWFGAKLGAAQGATDSLAKQGAPVNFNELRSTAAQSVTDAVFGAATGGALHLAIGEPLIKLVGRIGDAQKTGNPITPDQVLESFNESDNHPRGQQVQLNTTNPKYAGAQIDQGVAFDISQDLNSALKLGVGPEQARDKALIDTASGASNRSPYMIQYEYKVAKLEDRLGKIKDFDLQGAPSTESPSEPGANTNFESNESVPSTAKNTPTPYDLTQEGRAQDLKRRLAFEQFDTERGWSAEGAQAQTASKFKGQLQSMGQEAIDRNAKAAPDYVPPYERGVGDFDLPGMGAADAAHSPVATETPRPGLDQFPTKLKVGDKTVNSREIESKRVEAEKIFTEAGYSPEEAYAKSKGAEKAAVDFSGADHPSYEEAIARGVLNRDPKLAESVVADSAPSGTKATGPDKAVESIKDGDVKVQSTIGQKMYPLDLGEYAKGTSGGSTPPPPKDPSVVEGSDNDPFSANNTRDSLSSRSLPFVQSMSRPVQVWKRLGALGEQMGAKFTRWCENIRMSHAQFMASWELIKDRHNLTPEDAAVVRNLLNHTVTNGTPKQLAAAKEAREMFDGVVKKFVDQKLISKEHGKELLQKSRDEGYFPHVYDKAYMKSDAGKKAFFDAMSKVKFKNDIAVRQALSSILGEKSARKLSNYVVNNQDGTYSLVPAIYETLYKKSTRVGDAGLSSHMEKERKFPPEMEQMLQQFMVQDIGKALSYYSHDVHTRLESAKMWGNDNETYASMFVDAYKQNPAIAKSFKEAFFKQQGDPRSWGVQTFLNAADWQNNTSSFLRNLQLLKLTFSGITNLSQLPVNGALFLSAHTGLAGAISPGQALRIWMYGNATGWSGRAGVAEGFLGGLARRIGNKALNDEAKSFGAAIEHIHADFAGRIADMSPLGKKLGKMGVIGDLIKDPGTWLDLVRFNATEDINRIGGYHLGKQYILQLLKNKAALEGLGDRANPARLDKVNAALLELGIGKDVRLGDATVTHFENGASLVSKAAGDMAKAVGLGAQRTSNIINFVNDAHEMPHFYNSFMGKMFWQLKRFTYGQGALALEYALKPAMKGNILPLCVYLGVGTTAGLGVNKIRAWINADNKELTLTKRVLDAQANVASFGIVQSMLQSATYGRGAFIADMAGPGPSQVAGLATAFGDEWNQAAYQHKYNLNPVVKEILKQVSLPGKQYFKDQLTPPKSPLQGKFDSIKMGYAPFETPDKETKY